MHVWELRWRFPHKPIPEGFPRIFLRIEVPQERPGAGAGRCPQEIHEAWEEMREYGYCVACSHIPDKPPRQLPLESKQRIRRRNVWKRLLKKYPMFVSDFYREQVAKQPEHYGPFTEGEFADVEFARTTLGNLKLRRG